MAGFAVNCVGAYCGLWLVIGLTDPPTAWPESSALAIATVVLFTVGTYVGVLGATIARGPAATVLAVGVILLFAAGSAVVDWKPPKGLDHLPFYVALSTGLCLGGLVIPSRWRPRR